MTSDMSLYLLILGWRSTRKSNPLCLRAVALPDILLPKLRTLVQIDLTIEAVTFFLLVAFFTLCTFFLLQIDRTSTL
jgi:hypothetical protein